MQAEKQDDATEQDPTCTTCPGRQGMLEEYVHGLLLSAVESQRSAQRWRRAATLAVAVIVVVIVMALLSGCSSRTDAKPGEVTAAKVAAWDRGAQDALDAAGETAWDVILRCSRPPGCEYTTLRGEVRQVVDLWRWEGREDIVGVDFGGNLSPIAVHATRFDQIRTRAPTDTTAAQ